MTPVISLNFVFNYQDAKQKLAAKLKEMWAINPLALKIEPRNISARSEYRNLGIKDETLPAINNEYIFFKYLVFLFILS